MKFQKEAKLPKEDALRTYVEHMVIQISKAAKRLIINGVKEGVSLTLLVTGGGAHNRFLMERLKSVLSVNGIELLLPGKELVDYKEALIIALMGVLRWREEENVLSSVTGSLRNNINGAIWSS